MVCCSLQELTSCKESLSPWFSVFEILDTYCTSCHILQRSIEAVHNQIIFSASKSNQRWVASSCCMLNTHKKKILLIFFLHLTSWKDRDTPLMTIQKYLAFENGPECMVSLPQSSESMSPYYKLPTPHSFLGIQNNCVQTSQSLSPCIKRTTTSWIRQIAS